MTLHTKISPFLADFDAATGKGSLIAANLAMSKIIAVLVKHVDMTSKGCNCNCKTPPPTEEESAQKEGLKQRYLAQSKVTELPEIKALHTDETVKTDQEIDGLVEEPPKKNPPKKKV